MKIKGLDKLNNDIFKLTTKQTNKLGEISQIILDKNELVNKFVIDNTGDIKDVLDDLEDIKDNLYHGDYSIYKCVNVFEKYYTVAFKNAVTKTIETDLLRDAGRHGWGHGKNHIWINRRGVATRGYDRTATINNIDNILNVIRDMNDLPSYIKKSRKELVRNVVSCAKNMDGVELKKTLYTGYPPDGISFVKALEENGYRNTMTGIKDVKIVKKDYLAISVTMNRMSLNLSDKKDSYFWNSSEFSLTPDKEIPDTTKFVIGQLPDDAKLKINDFRAELTRIKNHNKKLLDKLTEQITPHLVMESL